MLKKPRPNELAIACTLAPLCAEFALSVGGYHNVPLGWTLGVCSLAFATYVIAYYLEILPDSYLPPLEVMFDDQNPDQKFWSVKLAKNEDGTPKIPPVRYWEYRVAIKNNSSKTVRNASVTTEWIEKHQNLPYQPAGEQEFEKTKTKMIDINPQSQELIRIHVWWYPAIQPGNFAGLSIPWYGKLKVTASGDDIAATTRIFKFNPEIEPMLFDPVNSS